MPKQEHPWARLDGNTSPYLHLLRDREGKANYEFRAEADGDPAEIWIYDVIDDWFGVGPTQIRDDLKAAGKINRIDVHINSPGGYVFDGHTIYNLLAQHPAQVTVYIDGLAASAASVIAMAGDRIVMPENGTMMIHEAWSIVIGPAEDIEAEARFLRRLNTQIAQVYAARTGNSKEQIIEWMSEETWFMGQEAEDAGFADETTPAKKAAALAGRELLGRYKHTPEAMVASIDTPTEPGPIPAALEERKMTDTDTGAQAEPTPETPDAPPETPKAEAPPESPETPDARVELKRYLDAFGPDGATWYAEGLGWEDAQAKYNAAQREKLDALQAENKALTTSRDAARDAAGTDPVSGNDGEGSKGTRPQGAFERAVTIRGR